MASDLYVFDGSSSSSPFCRHSSPEMISSDNAIAATKTATDLPFFCNNDLYPYLDALHTLTTSSINNNNNSSSSNPVDESPCFDHFAPAAFLSSSPPSHELETLTLSHPNNSAVLPNGYPNISGFDFDSFDVKSEQFFDGVSGYNNQTDAATDMARSYGAIENVGKYMQRSFSSNSVDGKPGLQFNSPFDMLVESPENGFFSGHMRRVYSTGDLQNTRRNYGGQRSFSSPLAAERSTAFSDEPSFKIGRYSVEERKEKISKYRAKRTQRNFNKTIKYACRKTLADNRPRIRGRFARNDEVVETPKNASVFARDDDDDDLWHLDGLHEEEEALVNSFVQPQLQYTTSLW